MSDSSYSVFFNKKELKKLADSRSREDNEMAFDSVEIDGVPMDVVRQLSPSGGSVEYVVFDTNRTGKRLGRVAMGRRGMEPGFIFDDGKLQQHKQAGGLILDKEERVKARRRRRQEDRDFEEFNRELEAQRRIDDVSIRKTRRRERVRGSWRDQGRGNCYTRTNKNGGKYVVCEEGSRGQKGVYQKVDRKFRGDPDQKGRDKSKAIKTNRPVLKKYDDEGRLEDLEDAIYYTPIRKDGGDVLLIPSSVRIDGVSVGRVGSHDLGYIDEFKDQMEAHPSTIRVPIDKFNAQYRTHRGMDGPGDEYDRLVQTEYELVQSKRQFDRERGGPFSRRTGRAERIRETAGQVEQANRQIRDREEILERAREEGGGFAGLRRAIRGIRRERRQR